MIEAFSGPFANTGDAVARNLTFAIERINARGGVALPAGRRPLQLLTFDSKGQVEEALLMFRRAMDQQVEFVLQGNSSAVAAALIDAVNRHNERNPRQRTLFLNYSAVDPSLTNERCSPWHFRFDAHVEMRMAALVEALTEDRSVRRIYLLNQDYSFGREVAENARRMVTARLPNSRIVGEELHPVGRVRDFAPYVEKIKASGADTVITGNWGNDLTLLVRASREAGLTASFYTFYGNGLGVPATIGEAGVGRVRAVAEWHPNAPPEADGAGLPRLPPPLPRSAERLLPGARGRHARDAGAGDRNGRNGRAAGRGASPVRNGLRSGRGQSAGQRPDAE